MSEASIRITKRIGNIAAVPYGTDIQKAIDRLAELEDKIESGKLKEFPCNIGDTIFIIFNNKIYESEVDAISIDKSNKILWRIKEIFDHLSNSWFDKECIGNIVFTTKPAAEKRLAEIKAGKV